MRFLAPCLALAFLTQCKSTSELSTANSLNMDSPPKLCAAVRGNGTWVAAHFGGLAKVVEELGVIEGVAGGSSASISGFIYDSMMGNHVLSKCKSPNATACKPDRQQALSLALKSVYGLLTYISKTGKEKILPFISFKEAEGIKKLYEATQLVAFASDSIGIIEKYGLKKILNPGFLKLIALTNHPSLGGYYKSEVKEALNVLTSGSFKLDSLALILRPGVINFPELAKTIGRVGDFYGGNHFSDDMSLAMDRWVSECAPFAFEKPWEQIKRDKPSCYSQPTELFYRYLETYPNYSEEDQKFQINKAIGSNILALITTSVLLNTQAAFSQLSDEYRRNQLTTPLKIDSDQLRFGYWGNSRALLNTVKEELQVKYPQDEKTKRFYSLGPSSWLSALANSPAEPGLSSVIPLEVDGAVSMGGWSDLHPVQVLKAAGCDKVVYITRRGYESNLPIDATTFLKIPRKTVADLYHRKGDTRLEASSEQSSFQTAVNTADYVLCTDWDSIPSGAMMKMGEEAYGTKISKKGSTECLPK